MEEIVKDKQTDKTDQGTDTNRYNTAHGDAEVKRKTTNAIPCTYCEVLQEGSLWDAGWLSKNAVSFVLRKTQNTE